MNYPGNPARNAVCLGSKIKSSLQVSLSVGCVRVLLSPSWSGSPGRRPWPPGRGPPAPQTVQTREAGAWRELESRGGRVLRGRRDLSPGQLPGACPCLRLPGGDRSPWGTSAHRLARAVGRRAPSRAAGLRDAPRTDLSASPAVCSTEEPPTSEPLSGLSPGAGTARASSRKEGAGVGGAEWAATKVGGGLGLPRVLFGSRAV